MFIEIIGEPGVGKSYMAQTFPNPFTIDATEHGECLYNVAEQYPDDFEERYLRIEREPENPYHRPSFDSARDVLPDAIVEYDTIVMETGYDLRRIMAEEWLEENNKDSVYPISHWGDIRRNKIMPIISQCTKYTHFVVIAKMGDQRDGQGNKTGARERKGLKKTDFMCDLRFYIATENNNRTVRVVKSRFHDDTREDFREINTNTFKAFKDEVPEMFLHPRKVYEKIKGGQRPKR